MCLLCHNLQPACLLYVYWTVQGTLSGEEGNITTRNIGEEMKIGGETIEVDEFVYLGRHITKHTDELEDTRRIGLAGNAYHTLLPVVKSREVHRQTKMKLHKTIMRFILRYVSEAWILSQIVEEMRNEFGEKILKKLYGCVLVNGQWRNRCNHEIFNFYKEMELARNVRLRRFHRVDHVMGMIMKKVLKKVLKDT